MNTVISPSASAKYAPGMRVLIRDAEWLIKRVELASGVPKDRPHELTCIGISNLVRGKEVRFLEGFEDDITILRPEETRLVQDDSRAYIKSKIFIESLLRKTPATDAKVHIAQHAAMDVLDYQLEPTIQALSTTRPRILIADAVGIGKTLEAGILVSELIERGRGRRILVLTVKAMLEQFQKEFWNRFSIPLTRLDSDGISRLQQRIPASHNPFLYVDKAIISIDTLKQDVQYRDYLKSAYWDIILIDEAHNVADRGTGSQRARLAKLLSTRSDALIMLSATPHDGKPESFASLIDILDPTVLPDKSHYTVDDFKDKGLVIRRFKADIKDQVASAFQMRDIDTIEVTASDAEEAVYQALHNMKFEKIDEKHKPGSELFKTTITKALFSSPQACISTVENRLKKLRTQNAKAQSASLTKDIGTLEDFLTKLRTIDVNDFSKFQRLVSLLKGTDGSNFNWNKKDPEDRLVIFTESRLTLSFLADHLPAELGLKDKAVVVLKGDDSDKDLMDAVERFNKADSPVRLMLATDVASEGLNLHRLCHRLIHFDIPWSLMTFQQRNGRVDRYGQTKQPLIRYLQTLPQDETLKSFGDAHIIELLIEKDNNAQKNIDDPREFCGTKEEQEQRTIAKVQNEKPLEEFNFDDPLTGLGFAETQEADSSASGLTATDEKVVERNLIFASDYDFVSSAIEYRKTLPEGKGRIDTTNDAIASEHLIKLAPPPDLEVRLSYLPKEVLPDNGYFQLTDDNSRVQESIRNASLNPNSTWPQLQLLWELHPVVQWMEDWAIGSFGRHSAPVLYLPDRLGTDEVWVLMQAGYPNRRGYTPVHDWVAVKVDKGLAQVVSRRELMSQINFARPLINSGEVVPLEELTKLLPICVQAARSHVDDKKRSYEEQTKPKLDRQLTELEELRGKQLGLFEELPLDLDEKSLTRTQLNQKRQIDFINATFKNAQDYVREVYELGKEPFIQVVAVFCGKVTDGVANVQSGTEHKQTIQSGMTGMLF